MRALSGGLSQGAKLRKQQGSDDFLSKVCTPNNRYRLFASIAEFDGKVGMVAPSTFGRLCDYDILGTSFYECKDREELDSGQLVDNSPLRRYAKIGKVLFDAECASEIANAQRKAKKDAEDMGEEVDVATLKATVDEIELRYHGGKVAGQNILPSKSVPIQGPKVYISTTFVLVRLDGEGRPAEDSIQRVVFAVTGEKRLSQLETCVNDADPDQLAAGYIEMKWDYTGSSDKKVCGQNAKFEAVPKDQQLATTHAGWWSDNFKRISDLLIYDPDMMGGRNRNISYQTSADEIIKRFKKYCSEKRALIPYIDMETDETKRAAEDLASIDVFMNNSKFNAAITAILEERKSTEVVEDEDELIDGIAGEINGSATLSEAVLKAGGIESLAGVLGADDMDMPSEL